MKSNIAGASSSGGGGGGAVTVADGADVNAGATTDAAVTADVNATLSGKTRGIVKILADIWDSVNHRANVAVQNFPAGFNVNNFPVSQTVAGAKTNNNAAPGATNIGAFPAIANAAVQTWVEGNQVAESSDLNGAIRVLSRPPVLLGSYRLALTTAAYTALGAGSAIYSFRWIDAVKICRITRVRIMVNTVTAATAAGILDRDLVIVRGFTAADTGGTPVTLGGNNQKMRTSQATTVVGSINITSGAALTPGTGTPDANAIGLVVKSGTATEPVGLTIAPEDLFIYNVGQNYPIILAQNEGFRIRIPTAMPSTIAMRSTVTVEWDEIAAANQF